MNEPKRLTNRELIEELQNALLERDQKIKELSFEIIILNEQLENAEDKRFI